MLTNVRIVSNNICKFLSQPVWVWWSEQYATLQEVRCRYQVQCNVSCSTTQHGNMNALYTQASRHKPNNYDLVCKAQSSYVKIGNKNFVRMYIQ